MDRISPIQRKHFTGSAIAILLFTSHIAAPANAMFIGMQWAAHPANPESMGGGQVNVVLTGLHPGDVVAGIVFGFSNLPSVELDNPQVVFSNWLLADTTAPLVPGTQYAIAASSPANFLEGPFDGLVGTLELTPIDPPNGERYDIGFDAASHVFGVYDDAGAKIEWDVRYAASYSGYVAYADYGNPGWACRDCPHLQATPNPLILINDVPEPSNGVLILLGSIALLWRAQAR